MAGKLTRTRPRCALRRFQAPRLRRLLHPDSVRARRLIRDRWPSRARTGPVTGRGSGRIERCKALHRENGKRGWECQTRGKRIREFELGNPHTIGSCSRLALDELIPLSDG